MTTPERRTPFDAALFSAPDARAMEAKACVACREVKSLTEFSSLKAMADGLAYRCRTCSRASKLSHYFGLDLSAYGQLLESQGGRCAVCGIPAAECRLPLAVDHDHACCPTDRQSRQTCGNCVRGLICDPCNRAIGLMCDSPERLRRAADYLSQPREQIERGIQLPLEYVIAGTPALSQE